MSDPNNYFDKMFCINLYDRDDRWKQMEKQFKENKLKVERFIAVDGRCKNSVEGCMAKLKSFEIAYNVKIKLTKKQTKDIKTYIPAISLTIGTLLLLRNMIKNKWKRILIFEDDVVLEPNFKKKFREGVKEIEKKRWDLLYLGCGNLCGTKGITDNEDDADALGYVSNPLGDIYDLPYYTKNKDDLRVPCYGCKEISKHISVADTPGGTWCYAISLAGAKKIVKILNENVAEHIDQIYMAMVEDGDLKALAFDPVIVYHEGGVIRDKSDIPWKF